MISSSIYSLINKYENNSETINWKRGGNDIKTGEFGIFGKFYKKKKKKKKKEKADKFSLLMLIKIILLDGTSCISSPAPLDHKLVWENFFELVGLFANGSAYQANDHQTIFQDGS